MKSGSEVDGADMMEHGWESVNEDKPNMDILEDVIHKRRDTPMNIIPSLLRHERAESLLAVRQKLYNLLHQYQLQNVFGVRLVHNLRVEKKVQRSSAFQRTRGSGFGHDDEQSRCFTVCQKHVTWRFPT